MRVCLVSDLQCVVLLGVFNVGAQCWCLMPGLKACAQCLFYCARTMLVLMVGVIVCADCERFTTHVCA